MEAYNRIGAEWTRWQEIEKRMEKLVPGNIQNNKPFLKEKLSFIESLPWKYSGSLNNEERLTIHALNVQRKSLEKTLFPNAALRLLRNLILVFKQPQHVRKFQEQTSENELKISDSLKQSGFSELNNKVLQQMKQGKESFSIPLSAYFGEKDRVDYTVNFVKDRHDQYIMEGYKAEFNIGKEQRMHNFKQEDNIDANHAYHLLAGRSILQPDPDGRWNAVQWIQLDFNDKDAQGNFRTKVLKKDDTYDVANLFSTFGIKDPLKNIETSLKNGEQVLINLKDNSYRIEANPQQNTLNFFDHDGNKISIDQLKDQKKSKLISLKPVVAEVKKGTRLSR